VRITITLEVMRPEGEDFTPKMKQAAMESIEKTIAATEFTMPVKGEDEVLDILVEEVKSAK
jgi:hypothetical protein